MVSDSDMSKRGSRHMQAVAMESGLALLAVAVDAQNDFGEETDGPKGEKLNWFTYEINK